jgi:hypothetical protein
MTDDREHRLQLAHGFSRWSSLAVIATLSVVGWIGIILLVRGLFS